MSSHSTHDFDTLNSLQDNELAQLAQRGQEQARQVLVERYQQPFTRALRAVLSREASPWQDAEEIANSTFFVAIPQFDSTKGEFYNYAWKVALNQARDLMRKRGVERATLERYAQECLVDTHAQSSRSWVIRASGRKVLADAITKLPDRPRQCLLLQHYGNGGGAGLSYKQIGEILGITPNAVGRYISDAKEGLRKELQRLKKEDIWEDA